MRSNEMEGAHCAEEGVCKEKMDLFRDMYKLTWSGTWLSSCCLSVL